MLPQEAADAIARAVQALELAVAPEPLPVRGLPGSSVPFRDVLSPQLRAWPKAGVEPEEHPLDEGDRLQLRFGLTTLCPDYEQREAHRRWQEG